MGEFSPRGKDTELKLLNTAPGIYLLKVLRQGKYKTFKFVIE